MPVIQFEISLQSTANQFVVATFTGITNPPGCFGILNDPSRLKAHAQQ